MLYFKCHRDPVRLTERLRGTCQSEGKNRACGDKNFHWVTLRGQGHSSIALRVGKGHIRCAHLSLCVTVQFLPKPPNYTRAQQNPLSPPPLLLNFGQHVSDF